MKLNGVFGCFFVTKVYTYRIKITVSLPIRKNNSLNLLNKLKFSTTWHEDCIIFCVRPEVRKWYEQLACRNN